MRKINLLNIDVDVHNKREEKLVKIMYKQIFDCIDCDARGLYNTRDWYVSQIDGMFTALYFMGCVKEPVTLTYQDLVNNYIPYN